MSSKAEWETYAANIDGLWQLCANCQPDSSAKKLFRQYNYNRTILGLPIALSPIDNTEWCGDTQLQPNFDFTDPASPFLLMTGSTDGLPSYLIVQAGSVMTNPFFYIPDGLPGNTYFPGDTAYDFWLAFITKYGQGFFNACCTKPDGAPGLTGWVTPFITI